MRLSIHTSTALYIPLLPFSYQFAVVNVAYVGALGPSGLDGQDLPTASQQLILREMHTSLRHELELLTPSLLPGIDALWLAVTHR